MFRGNVKGGTGARSKSRPDPTITKCECGGYIAKIRADQGATKCTRCESPRQFR